MSNTKGSEFQSVFLPTGDTFSITLSQLRIEPYEVLEILDVRINQKINEHGTLYLKARLPEGEETRDLEAYAEGKNVSLNSKGMAGEHILFQGITQEIKVSLVEHVYYIEVNAISYSYLLDIEQKVRSFQDKKQTYTDLITQITDEYPDAGVIDTASNGATTNQFLMQYHETDWVFLQRLASHFNTGLICDIRFDSPKYFFGTPDIPGVELQGFNYTVRKDIKRFRQLSKTGVDGLEENDFICYEVDTNQAIQVGSCVKFKGKNYYVDSIKIRNEKELFITRCTFMAKKGLSQPYKAHDEIAGCSFNGRIIDIKNDQVKVHLDVDGSQDVETAHYFPYSTVYSSEDGSGWYAMPCMNDNVRVYFPDGDDSHAYAISSVHEPVAPSQNQQSPAGSSGGGGGGGATPPPSGGSRDNPDIKSLRHPSGKEITLTEDGIYITDGVGTIISLTDDGVMIQSEKDIEFNSEQNIVIAAEEKIEIYGEESVEIYGGDTANIRLEDDVEIMGQEVKSN